jgi:hypothetical protein
MQSIVLFDQKAAAIIAICVGTIYVFCDLTKKKEHGTYRSPPLLAAGA